MLFVMLPLLLLQSTAATGWQERLLKTSLWQVLGSLLLRIAAGLSCGWLERPSRRHGLSETLGWISLPLALALTVLGAVRTLGCGADAPLRCRPRRRDSKWDHPQSEQ